MGVQRRKSHGEATLTSIGRVKRGRSLSPYCSQRGGVRWKNNKGLVLSVNKKELLKQFPASTPIPFSSRFAQFFICPLFTPSATDREVNAVNSENEKNIQMDSRRLLQVSKSTYDQSHPYSHFGTGDLSWEILYD